MDRCEVPHGRAAITFNGGHILLLDFNHIIYIIKCKEQDYKYKFEAICTDDLKPQLERTHLKSQELEMRMHAEV